MIRVIKRYGSRKLYDTEESRYVSLEELAAWVRNGQQVQVVDNQSADDVTAHTLTQVILEEGKRSGPTFSADFLHNLIRRGEEAVSSSVGSIQAGVDRLIEASVDRVPPLRALRDETRELRQRLEALEAQIGDIESVLDDTSSEAGDEPLPSRIAAARVARHTASVAAPKAVPRRKGA